MPAAKFEIIYKDLKKKIEGNTYPAEAVFPSENELTEAYGCSRATLWLVSSSRAISRPGRGGGCG